AHVELDLTGLAKHHDRRWRMVIRHDVALSKGDADDGRVPKPFLDANLGDGPPLPRRLTVFCVQLAEVRPTFAGGVIRLLGGGVFVRALAHLLPYNSGHSTTKAPSPFPVRGLLLVAGAGFEPPSSGL